MEKPVELCGGKVVHRKLKTAKRAKKNLRDGKDGKLSLYRCSDKEGLQKFGFHYHLGNLIGKLPKRPRYKRKGRRVNRMRL